ncbi:hypothetical protein [Rhizobium pisi]|uniref:hypothetical protein n=1 Tax=Rhizobium pisi TaxID=574561 RepID=UPI003D082682
MTTTIVATDVVRLYLSMGVISIEELIDIMHEQLDLIERSEVFADTTTWMSIIDFANRVQKEGRSDE